MKLTGLSLRTGLGCLEGSDSPLRTKFLEPLGMELGFKPRGDGEMSVLISHLSPHEQESSWIQDKVASEDEASELESRKKAISKASCGA